MSVYVIINLAVIAMPLLLSFDRRVSFFRRWPAMISAAVPVGAVYIIWDIFATARGDWGFNEAYISRFDFFGLPPGELLFFFTVPFSCLFIYEVVLTYFREKTFRIPRFTWIAPIVVFAALAVVFRNQKYTFLVMLSVAVFFGIAVWTPLLGSRRFWIFLGLSFAAFLIINGILTALPVVVYGDAAIWGVRVYRIPLEDFFYCVSLLGFNLLLYRVLRNRLKIGGDKEDSRR